MKVLALGGPGAMGAVAVGLAAKLSGVTEIVVADRDLAAAEALVHKLTDSSIPIRALRVDVTDTVALVSALADADVVMNTVGPYYRFGMAVLRAAIEAGTHYVDICDDWEPTQQMLELDADAVQAGVCAIVGMGASPGVSNLLAARAARELDVVRDIYTAWPVDVPGAGDACTSGNQLLGADGHPTAAAVHWMQQISGTVAVVQAGRIVQKPPLYPVTLSLPGGRKGTGYVVGHPEPVTLARTIRPTDHSANLMVVTPTTAAYLDILRDDIDAGRLTNETAAADFAKPSLRRGVRAMARATKFRSPDSLPPFFAVATGSKDGELRTVLAHLDANGNSGFSSLMSDMAMVTGVPLALGLAQLVDGTAARPGVQPPDAVIDADRFFDDLARAVNVDHATTTLAVESVRTADLHVS